MSNLQRHAVSSSSQLLGHILDRPELLAAVRELSGGALSRLIDRIGLEDAGELVALATTEQLAALFDEDLWHADGPGREERFDPQRFALWLSVMAEAGTDFLVQRLCELPRDLLTLAVHRLVLVVDMDAMTSALAGARAETLDLEKALESCLCEEWDEFRLIARDPNVWDDVWHALLSLDRDHHELLRDILERCTAMSLEFINGQGGLYEVLTSDEMLEGDELGERDDRRAVLGYVAPADARSFLELARLGTQPLSERDAVSAAHFRSLDARGARAHDTTPTRQLGAATGGADVDGLMELIAASDPDNVARAQRVLPTSATKSEPASGRKSSRPAPAKTTRPRAAATSKRSKGRSVPPPPAAEIDVAPAKTALALALAELSTGSPEAHAQRMEELGFLANVLVSGCPHAGRTLRPVEALEAAVAACSLGFELWPTLAIDSHTPEALLRAVSCDRLFRAAWPVYQRQLVLVARSTLDQCAAHLQGQRLIRAQKLVRDDAVFGLREVCRAEEIGLDDDSFYALLALAEALPWLHVEHARDYVEDAPIWIATTADLARARSVLSACAAVSAGARPT